MPVHRFVAPAVGRGSLPPGLHLLLTLHSPWATHTHTLRHRQLIFHLHKLAELPLLTAIQFYSPLASSKAIMAETTPKKKEPTASEAMFFFAIVKHTKNKADIDWEAVATEQGFKNAEVAKVYSPLTWDITSFTRLILSGPLRSGQAQVGNLDYRISRGCQSHAQGQDAWNADESDQGYGKGRYEGKSARRPLQEGGDG